MNENICKNCIFYVRDEFYSYCIRNRISYVGETDSCTNFEPRFKIEGVVDNV